MLFAFFFSFIYFVGFSNGQNISLFQTGKEYVYAFSASLATGSLDFVSYASVVNITGELHIQGTGSTLNVQLQNPGVALGTSLLSSQISTSSKIFPQLSPLSQPFSLQLVEGKINGLTLNRFLPEWARNLQKRIADTSQLDLSHLNLTVGSTTQIAEKTIIGDCTSNYTVILGADPNHVQVRKDSSLAQCTNIIKDPLQLVSLYNILNSTSSVVFDLELRNGTWVATKIYSVNALVFSLAAGLPRPQFFTVAAITATLNDIKDGSTVPGPVIGVLENNLKISGVTDLQDLVQLIGTFVALP